MQDIWVEGLMQSFVERFLFVGFTRLTQISRSLEQGGR